jgi:hypothetical protein
MKLFLKAKAQLTHLLRHMIERKRKRHVLLSVREAARRKMTQGSDAARSQDFLYDNRGMPH